MRLEVRGASRLPKENRIAVDVVLRQAGVNRLIGKGENNDDHTQILWTCYVWH